MARFFFALLAVLPVFALAMDKYAGYICPIFAFDGSAPSNQALYGVAFVSSQPLKCFAAAEPLTGIDISCLKMSMDALKGVSVTYNYKNVARTAFVSTSYDPLTMLMNYKFNNCPDYLFGSSLGGSITLAYIGRYLNDYWVYADAVWTIAGCYVRYYVFVANNFDGSTVNFVDFQAGFKSKYGASVLPKTMC